MTQLEEWRDITGFEGYYQISNLGRVKSLKRVIPFKQFNRKVPERILKQSPNGRGYLGVNLHKDGVKVKGRIHILVAQEFLNHKPIGFNEDIVVDHIDNDKSNNKADNLQLISNRENLSKDRRGASKYTGVFLRKSGRWVSEIVIKKVKYWLGSYDKEYDAHIAYVNALTKYKQHNELPTRKR